MALPFTGVLQQFTPEQLASNDKSFALLADTDYVKLVHLHLPKGTDTGVHDVDRSVVVTILSGHINFVVAGQDNDLHTGDCIVMEPKESHNVIALEDSHVLVAQSNYPTK